MENYENKELLKEAAKQSLESLKDLKPGTDEYTNTAKMALQLYDMQLKSDEQESNQNLKEDEERPRERDFMSDNKQRPVGDSPFAVHERVRSAAGRGEYRRSGLTSARMDAMKEIAPA